MRKGFYTVGRFFSFPYRGVSSSFQRLKDFFFEEPEDTDLADVVSKSVTNIEGIFYHLDILRKHLLRSILFLFFTTAVSFAFTRQVIDILARPIGGMSSLTAIEVTEPISVFMRVALLAGFTLALPYIAFELWLFVAPGLSARSRMMGLAALPAVAFFFLSGVAFAYFVMLPVALPFLVNFMEMSTQIRPASYIKFVTGVLFWIGIAFEFPLVIYILASIGLVKPKMLLEQWRLAVVLIAVLAAMVTPTVDPINMAIVMAPMILLYFVSIGLAKIAQRRRGE